MYKLFSTTSSNIESAITRMNQNQPLEELIFCVAYSVHVRCAKSVEEKLVRFLEEKMGLGSQLKGWYKLNDEEFDKFCKYVDKFSFSEEEDDDNDGIGGDDCNYDDDATRRDKKRAKENVVAVTATAKRRKVTNDDEETKATRVKVHDEKRSTSNAKNKRKPVKRTIVTEANDMDGKEMEEGVVSSKSTIVKMSNNSDIESSGDESSDSEPETENEKKEGVDSTIQ